MLYIFIFKVSNIPQCAKASVLLPITSVVELCLSFTLLHTVLG